MISRIIIWGEIPTITVFYADTAPSAIMLLILATTPRPSLFVTGKCRWSSLPYSGVGVLGTDSTLLGQGKICLEISFHCECSNVVFFFLYNCFVGKSVNCSAYLLFWGCRVIKNVIFSEAPSQLCLAFYFFFCILNKCCSFRKRICIALQ